MHAGGIPFSSRCSATSGMALTLACAARTLTTGRTGRGGTTLRANLIDSSHIKPARQRTRWKHRARLA
nr:MAG TPA_asm: hypothetical protein [Caudoviricetes sp.]